MTRNSCTEALPLIATLGMLALAVGCDDGDSDSQRGVGTSSPATGGTSAGGAAPGSFAGGGGKTMDHMASSGGNSGAECSDDSDCELPGECSSVACEAGSCRILTLARGSTCETGFCNGLGRCLPCLDDAAGLEQDSGCPTESPVCDETSATPACAGCREDSDCDDRIQCTLDRCTDLACEHRALPLGAACLGGLCNGLATEGSCVPCVSDDTIGLDLGCTADRPKCDTSVTPAVCIACQDVADCNDQNECTADGCSGGACEHRALTSGTPCTGGYCNGISGAEICVVKPCDSDESCDDGVACTSEFCDGFTCAYTPDDGECPDSEDVCRPNICTVGTGCQEVDNSRSLELLTNAHLDSGNVDWTEMSRNYPQVIYLVDYIPTLLAHTDPYVAWLGGGEGPVDEYNSLSQEVSIPAATLRLELSFFYQIWTDELPDDQNEFRVSLRLTESSEDEEIVTLHNQDGSRVWTGFSASLDVARWAGSDATLTFNGSSVNGFTAFFVDTISLTATVCE